jgi:hypothetical protein
MTSLAKGDLAEAIRGQIYQSLHPAVTRAREESALRERRHFNARLNANEIARAGELIETLTRLNADLGEFGEPAIAIERVDLAKLKVTRSFPDMQDRQQEDQDGHASGIHELRPFKAGHGRPIRSQLRRPVRAR